MPKTLLMTLALAVPASPALAAGDCPAAMPRVMVERFISADCEACWQGPAASAAGHAFVLDWIVASPRGADAPLSVASLPEAGERAARAGTLAADAALQRSLPLPARPALQIEVLDGPSLNGYIGLQMSVRQRFRQALPAGLVGYIAVVEQVPAGSEGNAAARRLVRTLIGPLPLLGLAPGHPSVELRATRFPENAKPERLTAVAWVETADGKPLATASAPFAGCGAAL